MSEADTIHDQVIHFIDRFTDHGKRQEVIECFTQGCCFWFAFNLHFRFKYDSEIVYDPIAGHFGCRIAGRVYDITGDATDGHKWEEWGELFQTEPNRARNIRINCIEF